MSNPKCSKETFDKLRDSDEAYWQSFKEMTEPQLDHDIKQSILKGLRKAELVYSEGIVRSLAYDVRERTWETFRDILTRPNSSFKWVSGECTYNYLRKTSSSIIRKALKKFAKEEADPGVTHSLDALADEGEHILENFLFQHGGYDDTDIDQEIILKARIDGLIELIDEQNISPLHRRMLFYRVVEEQSSQWIADKLGVTPATVDTTLTRLRKQLRERTLVKESMKENRRTID